MGQQKERFGDGCCVAVYALSFSSMNIAAWLLGVLALALGAAWLRTLQKYRAREVERRDILTAFASRNDDLINDLTANLPADQQTLWRRLSTQRAALEESQTEQGRARRDLEDVLASLQDAVLVVDAQARLRFVNHAALQLFDLRIEDVLGANLIEALPSFGIDAAMRAALGNGQSSAQELHLYAPKIREVFLRVAPVYSGAGAEVGAVAIVQDMTELRRLERVRRDFVANASHELRTPIANIRATAETLLHAPGDARLIERFLPPLVSEAERLSRLVSDLLDLARAEADEKAVRAPVELNDLVCNVVDSLRDKAGRNGVEISWQAGESAPIVSGDAAALEQVAFNLLDNALSYTPRGGQVALSLCQKNGDNTTAILEVSDTGIGIPADDLPRVFERFYRVDKARSRSEGGTGLGLAIVKHIVENHGGHVEVESQEGHGTAFRVELPMG